MEVYLIVHILGTNTLAGIIRSFGGAVHFWENKFPVCQFEEQNNRFLKGGKMNFLRLLNSQKNVTLAKKY